MPFAPLSASPSPAPPRRAVWLCAGAIALAVLAAYANTFGAPMVFDDRLAILENPSIREWRTAFSPPNAHVAGALGRPVVNFSLAVNYAVSGEAVWSYHVANLLLHAGCAVLLFAVARRALELPALRGQAGGAALPVAFTLALLWAVHPLQTESVTSVVQRNEILMSLCLLGMLYGLLRADAAAARSRAVAAGWQAAAVLAVWIGMGCKETMAMAPLLALAFDRMFLSPSWRAVFRARWWAYAAMAAAWLWLATLVEAADNRGGTVGFGLEMEAFHYALKQCQAVVHYLWLTLWPHPLALDYGTGVVTDPLAVAPQAALLAALVAGTAWALWRGKPAGFLGLWFFLLLGPSSSFLPLTTQTMAEHRMYLPLAALAALAAAGLVRCARRGWLPLAGAAAAALALITFARNHDYRSAISIWEANVRARPGNPRGHYNLGCALYEARDYAPAAAAFEAALRLGPTKDDLKNNLNNLGLSYLGLRQFARAEGLLRERLALGPEDATAHYNLGLVLAELGRDDEAIAEFADAISRNSQYADARHALALALERVGQRGEALVEYEQAVALAPDNFSIRFNYANALFKQEVYPAAIAQYHAAVRLEPANAEARNNFGGALLKEGKVLDAIVQFEAALRLRPDYADARDNLAAARALVPAAAPER